MTLASGNDLNITKSEGHVESGTSRSDYASTPNLVDKLERADAAETGPILSGSFRLPFAIKRLMLADRAFSLASHLVNPTPMCDGVLPSLDSTTF